MLYNDNPRTIKDFDENKKRLKKEAERETLAGKQKMQIEEQRRKQLKVSDKKREIDELIKKLALQESALRRIASELNTLKLGEQREKSKQGELIRKTEGEQSAIKTKITAKESELKKAEQEEISIKIELAKEDRIKIQAEDKEKDVDAEKKRLELLRARVAGKISEIEKLKKEIYFLKQEEQKYTQLSVESDEKITPYSRDISRKETELEKNKIDMERIKKEIDDLKSKIAPKILELERMERLFKNISAGLNTEKQREGQWQAVKNADYSGEEKKFKNIETTIAGKTAGIIKFEQEISLLRQEEDRHQQLLRNLESQINLQLGGMSEKEADLAKKIHDTEKLEIDLKKDLIVLEKEGKAKQKLGEIIKEKSPLEMIQRRILAVGDNIQKANREIAGLKTELRKKEGELRALMA